MKRILVLLLVITGLYIVFNQAPSFEIFGADKGVRNDGQAVISNNTKVIKVDVSSVSTTIIPEDRPNLKAVYDGEQKLTVAENGDSIEVYVKSKVFNWFNWPSKKSKLTIYIPKNYERNMMIDLGSGNLNFFGQSKEKPMKLDELTVDIGSGDMNLQNLVVQHFNHDVSSGNVNIDSLQTKTGILDVSSGNLAIKHYIGALDADVSSGRLTIQMDELSDTIKLDVSSGDAGLDLPDNADFTLNADVSSGNVSCDFPLTSKELNKKKISGTHGTGKYKIDLEVSSGNLNIH
jgi:lia operon protein LiaG